MCKYRRVRSMPQCPLMRARYVAGRSGTRLPGAREEPGCELVAGPLRLGHSQVRQKRLAVRFAPALAEFELAFKPLDFEFEADDLAHKPGRVSIRQGVEVVFRFVVLELPDQVSQERVQSRFFGDGLQAAAGMDDGEIPGRHGLGFSKPCRRDIRVWSLEHHHGLLPAVEGAALRVMTREVSPQRAVPAGGTVEHYRDVSNA